MKLLDRQGLSHTRSEQSASRTQTIPLSPTSSALSSDAFIYTSTAGQVGERDVLGQFGVSVQFEQIILAFPVDVSDSWVFHDNDEVRESFQFMMNGSPASGEPTLLRKRWLKEGIK